MSHLPDANIEIAHDEIPNHYKNSVYYRHEFEIDSNLFDYIRFITRDFCNAIIENNKLVYNMYDINFDSNDNKKSMWQDYDTIKNFISEPSSLQLYIDVHHRAFRVIFTSDGHTVKHTYYATEGYFAIW